MDYHCYLIVYKENDCIKRTYIGITNNLNKRIKQHNGLISGGAKSTRCSNEWYYHTIVSNFKNKGEALSFEYNWKKYSRAGIDNKIKQLNKILPEAKFLHLKAQQHEENFDSHQANY